MIVSLILAFALGVSVGFTIAAQMAVRDFAKLRDTNAGGDRTKNEQ